MKTLFKRLLIAAFLAGFFGFLLLGDQGVYQLARLLDMKHALLTKRQTLKQKIEELKQEQELLEQPEHLEMTVREELGVIKPGEILFQEKPSNRKSETSNSD